jgi:hypothetical protein
MIPIEWFNQYAPGFARLTAAEREAINDFALVWPLFEAKVLNNNASSNAIGRVVAEWARQGKLVDDPFAQAIAHIQDRYCENARTNHRFDRLNLRENDKPEMIRRVVLGQHASTEERAAAALIVAYRFRNNLYHGAKLDYGIQEQQDNFEIAKDMLMKAIDLHHA